MHWGKPRHRGVGAEGTRISGIDLVRQILENQNQGCGWSERAEREIFRNTPFTTRSQRARWNWNAAGLAEPVRWYSSSRRRERARYSRVLTTSSETPRHSAVSAVVKPSASRRTNTAR